RPQPAPNPLLKALQHGWGLALSEIADPSPEIPGEFLDHPFRADPPCPARQFPDPLLEPQHRFRRNPPLRFPVEGEATAQNLPFSITPAFRNARISFSMRRSLILVAILAISLSCETRSKIFLEVQVHTPATACGNIPLRRFHRLMRRAPGSKPVAVIGKRPVPPALQDLHHRLLDKSVQYRRDAKLPHPSVRLGDFYPPHPLR